MSSTLDTKQVSTRSESQKRSRRKASTDDSLQETMVTAGTTHTSGQAVPAFTASSRRELRPNRSAPVNEIDLIVPFGDELDKLVDKFPAPPEWADE